MTLTVEQVAERLSLTPRHVRDLIRTGVLPGFKRGVRVWGVVLADLEKWIKSRQKAG
jgi:excisionase family DNA binding protein